MCAVIKTMYVSRYGWVNFGDSLGCVWIHKTEVLKRMGSADAKPAS